LPAAQSELSGAAYAPSSASRAEHTGQTVAETIKDKLATAHANLVFNFILFTSGIRKIEGKDVV
jgi:hypothetical protein